MTVRQRRIMAAIAAVPMALAFTAAATGGAAAESVVTVPAPVADTATATINPYAPSGVGEGDNQGNGKAPANGTVGKADDKNPPGQAPNGTDLNKGYECDQNKGVGDKGGNPAHSGCTSPSATPTATVSPSPSSTPTRHCVPARPSRKFKCESSSPSPTGSPIHSTTPTQPVTKPTPPESATPSPTPSPSESKPATITCKIGPCVPPPPPPCTAGTCLPFTGAATDVMLPVGVFSFLGGLMILALMNLATQTRKYILQT